MSPMLISAILGVAITVLTLGQVAPSISAGIFAKATESGIGREEALVQQILQYRTVEGAYPASVANLISKNYWRTADNTNGFGGTYSFTIDEPKGLISISTTIANAASRTQYVNNYRHVFKPVDQGAGVIMTTFVMPNTSAIGAPLPSTGSIPASASAPSAASNTFWYDTSGPSAVMKVSNGSTWLATTTASVAGGINSKNISANANELPVTASEGDVRYVYNAASSTLDTLNYYNGAWTQVVVATPPVVIATPTVTALAIQNLPLGHVASPFNFDFKPSVSAMDAGTQSALTVDTSKVAWTIQGAVPAGLSLDFATGVLSGTPTAKTTRAGSAFNVIATYGGSAGKQNYTIKVSPPPLSVTSVGVGSYFGCALTPAGGVKCWGWNTNGQLGNVGGMISTPSDVAGLTNGVKYLATGPAQVCVVTTAGGAKCLGINDVGQLGDGTLVQRNTPVDVIGLTSGIANIAMGYYHACAVTTAGGAKCWGKNNMGQLGDGTTVSTTSPVDVVGLSTGVASIAIGNDHTCALMISGAVKCWGNGSNGRLGDGTSVNKSSPVNVTGLTSGVSSISTGVYSTCALTTVGGIKCWGLNTNGQLGDGTTTQRTVPTDVTGLTTGVTNIAAGFTHACAVTTEGGVKCWGLNTYGELGDATLVQRNAPVDVIGFTTGGISLAVGYNHTCAVTSVGRAKCWGWNGMWQLGDGSTTLSGNPVDVLTAIW